MTIEVCKMKNGQAVEALHSISDEAYAVLEPAFLLYNRRTGLTVDPYGDLKLSAGLEPLISALADSIPDEDDPRGRATFSELLDVLKSAEEQEQAVIFCGA